METYLLQVLSYASPRAVRQALMWRHSTLDIARARARELRLGGAAFPWRTIHGEECSGYWPAGTAGFHINADIADAVRRYVAATGDAEFEGGPGLELLVETARLWQSLGHYDELDVFRIDGVTGPDEYSALHDNNVFTNLMAARNLRSAADASSRHSDAAAALAVTDEEIAGWRAAAAAMAIPFDHELGVTQQSEGFTRLRHWDFAAMREDEYPLLLHFPYYLLYSSQVVKQADLVFALYLCSEWFTPEQRHRDFDYYEGITVRDSSLSASIQAIVAAEVGHLDLAYAYLRETAFVDLWDLARNTDDGVHLAAMAGASLAAVAGFGGMRDNGETLAFAPRLPDAIARMSFGLIYRGRLIRVSFDAGETRYELRDGEPIELVHHGETFTLTGAAPRTFPNPAPPDVPPVQPPPLRDPCRRGVGWDGRRIDVAGYAVGE
jgi:alpha,alpha-trehalose phosphorylase